ncbi:uncharacterized protein BDV17DRAFT_295820 [Aspergillus undulatus]|uniref:uncharacterized protein n=1 Tax=Aspergillus undulatus TaxID=1810928 RepID=UPI003CCD254D
MINLQSSLMKLALLLHILVAAAAPDNNTLSLYGSFDLSGQEVSAECRDVLQSNITCYRALPAAITETSSWSSDALSLICADACTASIQSWKTSAESACGQTTQYNVSGSLRTASSVADELLWKQSATCLQDSSGEFCNLVMQQAIKNADSDILCSDCALRYLTTVVNSERGQEFLGPETVEKQIKSCSATQSYSVTYTASTSSSAATTPTATAARCDTSDEDTVTYTIRGNETCAEISAARNVSTPSLKALNGLDSQCAYLASGQTLCLPDVCELHLVRSNDTCDSITGNLSRSVSTPTFQSWNPSINSKCSNLQALVHQYVCISPPGSMSIPHDFPLVPASTAAPVPDDAVTTSNKKCGYWYTIQDGDGCESVASTFGIPVQDFYFLNPQLGTNCSSLWLGNSYCVQPVGSIETYSGYNTLSATSTLASTINLNATRTVNHTTTHFFYSFAPPTTTAMTYNTEAWELTQGYTLCADAMAYYSISATTEWTEAMYENADWYEEFQRVCLVDPSDLPTSAFNTSIVLNTQDDSESGSSTIPSTGGLPTTTQSTTATATATPVGKVSPNGLCGPANEGYTCKGSTFGECCSTYGYCGSTDEYCGDSVCDPTFGECPSHSSSDSATSTASTTMEPTSTAISNISPNGLCGASNSGYTCLGSQFGDCCSQYGYW